MDFTYFIVDNIGLELIAATAQHNAQAIARVVGDVPLGSAWLLPPTLSLQYHILIEGFKPYVGAGVNYNSINPLIILRMTTPGLSALMPISV